MGVQKGYVDIGNSQLVVFNQQTLQSQQGTPVLKQCVGISSPGCENPWIGQNRQTTLRVTAPDTGRPKPSLQTAAFQTTELFLPLKAV